MKSKLTGLFLLGGLLCGFSPLPPVTTVINGSTMGTTYTVTIVTAGRSSLDVGKLEADIQALLHEVNRQMSTYLPDSEISRFNRYGQTDWFPAPADFARVVALAETVSAQSSGAFDVTVAPLVNLWGFGPEPLSLTTPSDAEITRLRAFVGYERLSVQSEPPALKKAIPELTCDLSAIAKGFAVDKIAVYLEKQKAHHFMVEIGGEVRVKGHSVAGRPWRIGLTAPDGRDGFYTILAVSDMAIATSGDYENFLELDGQRYSHTIDPATGRPITHGLASVTVLHPTCALADAYATAINVLGPQRGYDLAVAQNLPTLLIVRNGNNYSERATPGFDRFRPSGRTALEKNIQPTE